MNATLRRIRRGEQQVVRLQRRLWLAQLLFWPTAVVVAISAVIAAWSVWQRKTQPAGPSPSPVRDEPTGGAVSPGEFEPTP